MTLAGEIIPNEETRTVADLVRESNSLMSLLEDMDEAGLPIETTAASLRRSTVGAITSAMNMGDGGHLNLFFRAAVSAALRSSVDWESVVRMALTDEEAN